MQCVPDSRCDEIFPYQPPAVVRIQLSNGKRLESVLMSIAADRRIPLSDQEIETKFRINAARRITPDRIYKLTEVILGLAKAPDTHALSALLTATA